MVGVPEVASAPPVLFEEAPRRVIELALVFPELLGVEAAERADPPVAFEDLLAEVARIGAELPLVNARVGAERPAAARDFRAAPPARQSSATFDPATGLDAAGAHTRSS
jgi:hypothetical protein